MHSDTHATVGGVGFLGYILETQTTLSPEDLVVVGVGLLIAQTAANLPDLDVGGSRISRRLLFGLPAVFGRPFTHRGFTHSLSLLMMVTLLCAGLYQWGPEMVYGIPTVHLLAAVLIGFTSHILLDSLDQYGIYWLSPFSSLRFGLSIPFFCYASRTSGKTPGERLVLRLGMLTGMVLLFWTGWRVLFSSTPVQTIVWFQKTFHFHLI